MTDVTSALDVAGTTQSSTLPVEGVNSLQTPIINPNLSKRPRDAHTIHLILHQMGITAYQERVPLQLMDFAYRYTSSILQDALHLMNESYPGAVSTGSGSGVGRHNADGSTVNLSALRLAIRSRTHYQHSSALPKDFYTDMMQEKNRIALPPVQKDSGLRLPPEQYMLTGQHWEIGEEFDLMDTDTGEHLNAETQGQHINEQEDADDEAEGGRMEDLFVSDGAGDNHDMQEGRKNL